MTYYRFLFGCIVLLSSYGCVTITSSLSNENADRLLDATYYVLIHEDRLTADHIKESKYERKRGLIHQMMEAKSYKNMLNQIKPLADKVSDLDFKTEFINNLKSKLDFVDPKKFVLVTTPIENENDVYSLIESSPTNSVVLIMADYELDYGYKSYTVDVTLSVWDKNVTRPLFETFGYYNSKPVSFDHSESYIDKILPIWIGNNQNEFRRVYKEGLIESVDMVFRILAERHEYSKLDNYDTYEFFNYSTKTRVSGKILFSDDMDRKLVLDYFGAYHSIPTEITYSLLSEKIEKIPGKNGRLYVFCPLDACKRDVQPTLIIDGKRAGYIYKQGFFYKDLTPGEHTITFGYDDDRFLASVIKSQIESTGPVSLNVNENQHYYLRFNHPAMLPGYGAQMMSRENALAEISQLQYKGN